MTVLAVIPARGGSKAVPRKNLCQVGGVSLVGRAVRCCLAAGCFDRVLVSTEDPAIREEALAYGAEVPFLRPAELATDTASTFDAVTHALAAFESYTGMRVKTLVLVEPTNPFRSPDTLRGALEVFNRGEVGSVIGVCPLERKPGYIFVKKESGTLEPLLNDPAMRFSRRQDMVHLCRLSSTVYVVGRDDFLREHNFLVPPVGYVENTLFESVNIDSQLDLEFAEFLAQARGL